MNTDKKLRVTEIQRFCMHDGPGVRTTVFLKGCPLRCAWCHNPETQNSRAELLFYAAKCIGCGACAQACPGSVHKIDETHTVDRPACRSCFTCVQSCPAGALESCGREMTAAEILSVIERDRAFYGDAGGVTVSGGEPLMQGEAVLSLLQACKEHGIPTAMETCGYADTAVLEKILPFVDLFLWDVKDTDSARHKAYTGVSNEQILQNLQTADRAGARTRLRCILVNGVNTDRKHYKSIADLARTLRHTEGVEFLPYHAYGGTKSVFLGLRESGRTDWLPTAEQLEEAKNVLREASVNVF